MRAPETKERIERLGPESRSHGLASKRANQQWGPEAGSVSSPESDDHEGYEEYRFAIEPYACGKLAELWMNLILPALPYILWRGLCI